MGTEVVVTGEFRAEHPSAARMFCIYHIGQSIAR